MGFILINVFLCIVIFISLIVLWFVWPPDSPWSPWWQISKIEESLKLANVTKKDIVYDLGSGDGRIPILAARKFGAYGVGIEIDYIRHWIALLKTRLYKLNNKVSLKRGSFYNFKINDATVVFVYLVPRVLEKLKPKLVKELKKGTRVVSYKYKFQPSHEALEGHVNQLKFVRTDRKNQIHLYRIV